MYPANVVRVLIASPSDVSRERVIAHDVVAEWNIGYSEKTSLVLLPIRWETHASPEMGERPQGVINRQILASADLLVAMFWTGLGTPTGAAASGTVEEIRKHVAAGKPAMLYCSNAPAHPDSIDEEQIRLLRSFRDECMSTGLCECYDDPADLRLKCARQLLLAVNRRFADEGSPSSDAPAPAPLSEDATDLLLTAARDREGEIRVVHFDGGFAILSNGRSFNDESARSSAKWKAALQELVLRELVDDTDGAGRVYSLSQHGFQTADRLSGATDDA